MKLFETGSLYVSTATKKYYPWKGWPWIIILQLIAMLFLGNIVYDNHRDLIELKALYKLNKKLMWAIIKENQKNFVLEKKEKAQ